MDECKVRTCYPYTHDCLVGSLRLDPMLLHVPASYYKCVFLLLFVAHVVMDFFEDDKSSDLGPSENMPIMQPPQQRWEVRGGEGGRGREGGEGNEREGREGGEGGGQGRVRVSTRQMKG